AHRRPPRHAARGFRRHPERRTARPLAAADDASGQGCGEGVPRAARVGRASHAAAPAALRAGDMMRFRTLILGLAGAAFDAIDPPGRATDVRSPAYPIPMTSPAWEVPNGVLVSGPPLPDRRRIHARPASVEAELGTASPLSHDELSAAKRARDVARIDACNRFELDLLERTTRRYLEAGYELVVSFTGIPDTLHHAFWAFHDPRSPVHEPDAPAALRSIIPR